MESSSFSICLSSSSPPFQNHLKSHNPYPNSLLFFSNYNLSSSSFNPISSVAKKKITLKLPSFHQVPRTNSPYQGIKNNPPSHFQIFVNTHLSFLSLALSLPLSSLASETTTTLPAEEVSNKINIEAILVSIDDFFNRYPFFVAGVTFIWLVVIPLTEDYLQKFKFISAINAFRKLRDDPSVELLDIRDEKSLRTLTSPILKILNKNVLQVEYNEKDEDGFVKKVLDSFGDPANTTICILDSFDDNSLKVAELLFKNGFREAYAIRGGVKGKNGWLSIQETLLPPSVHIFPKKKKKKLQQNQQSDNADQSSLSSSTQTTNGYVSKSVELTAEKKNSARSLSPYPKYPDLKPPSSPTPSKPKS
ncbi:rhodanese-like domain-containing protein 4A, chloroplastic [Heracleum sosnowskyi]|uniref:Rhodanese-like domain-containing protein 4A, chloroplastic n=1 Tax=Heracleum sosnowskyi TaxID=360622 RepID=A0AAD8GR52_9APIA|nr:rhodanese-like domain-containing protein 4A, chloroplastic [Heracleum sosnowskyi]